MADLVCNVDKLPKAIASSTFFARARVSAGADFGAERLKTSFTVVEADAALFSAAMTSSLLAVAT